MQDTGYMINDIGLNETLYILSILFCTYQPIKLEVQFNYFRNRFYKQQKKNFKNVYSAIQKSLKIE